MRLIRSTRPWTTARSAASRFLPIWMAGSAAEIGGMASCEAWTVTMAIGIAAPIGMAAEAVLSGCSRIARPIDCNRAKAVGFRRLFRFSSQRVMPGKSTYLAGHRGVALLNDALLRRLSGPVSGRIAQLVEQMTLNHRVPGSSPGAPTKLFNGLADFAV